MAFCNDMEDDILELGLANLLLDAIKQLKATYMSPTATANTQNSSHSLVQYARTIDANTMKEHNLNDQHRKLFSRMGAVSYNLHILK